MTKFNKTDKVKIQMKPEGWMIGEVKFIKTLDDGRSFYYVKAERVYKDGQITPAKGNIDDRRLWCIPSFIDGLVTGA
jgi:hypothetical protein